ncbi:MAG TPA: glycosyltransferase [Ilumatobacteraceae bacterium]|nr:glycosyltransferase [Ilumatobacteraceae bacterium]
MISTYPPRLCGLATFAAALGGALARAGHLVEVMRLQDGTDLVSPIPPVIGDIVNGNSRSIRRAAARLSLCDAVIIQHEYGIFGGVDGREVLDLVDGITAPVVTVLHTVPRQPTPGQRFVLNELCARSTSVVVMSQMAERRLLSTYVVDASRVDVIPHGAVAMAGSVSSSTVGQRDARVTPRPPQLLTWGLLGPGKGIENVIDALALLDDMQPRPRYTIAGVTHPKVLTAVGDGYRRSLVRRVRDAGLAESIDFDDTYRDVRELSRFVASASLVVLPYDSRDQITSGVLVDALAAGRPVIATAFPHAVELLSDGAGIVVPHGDPAALAAAIRLVLEQPERLEAMAAKAREMAPELSWGAVSHSYAGHITRLLEEDAAVAI